MFAWLTPVLAFFSGKKGPYGVALAAFVLVGYLAYIDIPTVKLVIVAGFAAAVTIVYFLKNKEQTTDSGGSSGAVAIYVQFGNQEPIKLEEGHVMAYELSANNGFKIESFTGKDRLGNFVTIEAPQLSLSAEGVCELRTLADGSQYIIPVALGDVQLQLKADPIPGPEVGEVSGLFDIKVVPGAAVTVDLVPGPQVPVSDIPTE